MQNAAHFVRKVYILARPYGRKKLLLVSSLSLAQGLFQVLGVTSIFPFLAIAADPGRLRNSQVGQKILEILPEMDNGQLLILTGSFAIAMLFLANGVNLLAEFVRTRYSHNFGHFLHNLLLRKIASRPYADFLQENSSILIKKVVGDVIQFTNGVLLPLLDSLARVATIILLVGTLFLVQPQIAIGSSVAFGLFYAITFRIFGRWRRETANGLKEATRGLFTEVHQMLGGIKSVKIHRAEEFFISRFNTYSKMHARLSARGGIISAAPRYFIEPIAFGGLVLIVLIFTKREQDLISILPNLGVMALAGYRLLPALQLLYSQVTNLATQRHALDEVFDEFLAAERAVVEDSDTACGNLGAPPRFSWLREIRLDDISFRYPGAKTPVIQNLSISIPKNSALGIIGTTGCGKSTLVDLILGLHTPTAGRILIDDTPLGPDTRRAWRGGIGYVPQEIFLIDDTIAANIAFGIPADDIEPAALERAVAAAQILDFIQNDLPHGFETIVGERGVRLSGGQRQRIGLARALYHQPDLLVLDEATSALDITTEDGVMQAIANLSGEITMIIIAHRLRTIEMCTHRLDLSNPVQYT